MKKFITGIFVTIIAIVAFSINANAQNGQWKITYEKADEIKGTPALYSNLYIKGDNRCAIGHKNDETRVAISTSSGMFDCYAGYASVIIGFYKGGKLVEKVTTEFIVYKNPSALITWGYNTNGTKCLEAKILNHIKNVGDVRIIAPKYNGKDFDLTIPMNPNVK